MKTLLFTILGKVFASVLAISGSVKLIGFITTDLNEKDVFLGTQIFVSIILIGICTLSFLSIWINFKKGN